MRNIIFNISICELNMTLKNSNIDIEEGCIEEILMR